MLWRNNDRKNEPFAENRIEEEKNPETEAGKNGSFSSAIGPLNQSEAVQKVYTDVQDLKDKIERLKVENKKLKSPGKSEEDYRAVSGADEQPSINSIDDAAVSAAEQAVREHAKRDIAETKLIKQQELAKDAKLLAAKERAEKAQEKFAQKKKEAEEKLKRLEEAERVEKQVKKERKKAEIQALKNNEERKKEREQAALIEQKEAERLLEIEKKLEKERQEAFLRQQKKAAFLKKEKEKEERKAAAKIAADKKKNEALIQKREAQKKKEERENLIAEQRALQRKKRAEEKLKIRQHKQQIEVKKAEDRRARKARIKKQRAEKNELRRQHRFAKKSAEMGGGIVNVYGTTVKTEILPVSSFSIKDFFGRAKKKEISAAATEEERVALIQENERIKAEARATAAELAKLRTLRRKNNPIIVKTREALDFCDEMKKPLLIWLTIILIVAVGTSAVFNFCTAYEYSYAGHNLGYVKNKDDVLQITEMVQKALTEEKKVAIQIDAKQDIGFKRVYIFNKDVVIDSSDDVLRRLTYLGDVNVKGYGIYIDGMKAGAVQNKDTAANVLRDIMKKYQSNAEGSKVEKAEIVENIVLEKSDTPFREIMSEDAMVDKLCTDSVKETVHTVERGETLDRIATDHKLSVDEILKDNKELNKDGNLKVGSTIILKEVAPLMTVRITEVRTYEEKIDYKTIKKKDSDLYEGYTEVDQNGKKGLSDLKDRTVSINGEVVQTQNLENIVKEKPVEKIVRVGTKKRPPTVGSGTYIWPAYKGTYTVTSEFKWRWGRMHEGMDLGCRVGNDVLAADGGTVVYAGYMGGYGNLVIIDHQNGIKTYYGHNSSLLVHVGSKVFQGQHIAEAGNTGYSFGSHIHFGVMDHGSFKNPRNYLPKQ